MKLPKSFYGRARGRALVWLLSGVAVMLPLARLVPFDTNFAVDWYNHQWLTAYWGEYVRQHLSFPVVLNTTEQAGMPYPVFYGVLFYPVMSTLTAWINPGVALRLVALLVTWLQFRLVSRAIERLEVSAWAARVVACLVIWAIYPSTNLYNRSALTEYFATALLTCMLACWFMLASASSAADRRKLAHACGLLFTLAAGTHAITALYSVPMLVLLVAAAYQQHGTDLVFWKDLARALAIPTVAAVLTLAPWIYALARFGDSLFLNRQLQTVYFDTAALDHWTTRFSPIPYDRRSEGVPLSEVSTPYLDAQINLPLLLLLAGVLVIVAWRLRADARAALRSTALGLGAFAFFTWLSLCPSSFEILPSAAKLLQIAYRAITYQNLALLLATFSLFALLQRRHAGALFEGRSIASGLLVGCLALSGTGVVIKWIHATEIIHYDGRAGLMTEASQRRQWIALPPQFYGAGAYATPSRYREVNPAERAAALVKEVRIPVGIGDDFGITRPLELELPTPSWLATNVQAFPWNRLALDGVPVSEEHLRVESLRYAVLVPAGKHALALRTEPDTGWRVLRAISFSVLALWLGCVAYLNLKRRA